MNSNVEGATSYTLRYRVASTNKDNWQYLNGLTGTSKKITDLEPGHRYYFRVTAHNSAKDSPESAQATQYTLMDLSLSRVSATAMKLEWTKPQNAVSYTLYRRKYNASKFTKISLNNQPGDNSYTDTGLTAGTRYYYYISASCGDYKNSDGSDAISQTTVRSTYIAAPQV